MRIEAHGSRAYGKKILLVKNDSVFLIYFVEKMLLACYKFLAKKTTLQNLQKS